MTNLNSAGNSIKPIIENNSGVEIYDSSMNWLRAFTINKVARELKFSEGPVWHPDNYFIFSDTPANKIYQWNDGTVKDYYNNSGYNNSSPESLSKQIGSNGLAVDKNKNIIICQHGDHAIAVLNDQKELSTLVSGYEGKPFNSPNDLVIKSDGHIYFTDPPYGLKDEKLHPDKFQPLAGIYRYNLDKVELLGAELKYPNGICFSPDEKYLYVTSNFADEKYVVKYKVLADGNLKYSSILIAENADGMTIDAKGNIYLATEAGILIINGQGKKLAFIQLPETPTNLAWGGTGDAVLFITARSSAFYLVKQ